jgi:hypothetical protein
MHAQLTRQEKMKAKVAAIASHGITCFVNRQLIYNYPESLLAEQGIMAIEHADFEGVERLALVTGGDITSTFDAPDKVKIGRCDLIEEIMIGEDKVGCGFCPSSNYADGSSSNSPVSPPVRLVRSFFVEPPRKWLTRPIDPCMMPFPFCHKLSKRQELLWEVDVPRCS